MNEKTNIRILKISILILPLFLTWLFHIATTPLMVLLRFAASDPNFGIGVIHSIIGGATQVTITIISTYIAIYLWLKYVPKKEKN